MERQKKNQSIAELHIPYPFKHALDNIIVHGKAPTAAAEQDLRGTESDFPFCSCLRFEPQGHLCIAHIKAQTGDAAAG